MAWRISDKRVSMKWRLCAVIKDAATGSSPDAPAREEKLATCRRCVGGPMGSRTTPTLMLRQHLCRKAIVVCGACRVNAPLSDASAPKRAMRDPTACGIAAQERRHTVEAVSSSPMQDHTQHEVAIFKSKHCAWKASNKTHALAREAYV